MKNKLVIASCVIGLVAVRFISNQFFYDPLIGFFHNADYKLQTLPEIQLVLFSIHLLLRFGLNTTISTLLVYFLFHRKGLVRLTLIISAILGVILIPQVIFLSVRASPDEYAWLFYTRRMLIHPLLILILLPAYMFHIHESKQGSND